ncbi:protein FAM184B isoform X2 [Latimeria chalumnae]|uniref:protein FAM184B isoform X2 n=1 Tax=Latimeria chalumnae TaxID=7897 RepID=UPI00313B6337
MASGMNKTHEAGGSCNGSKTDHLNPVQEYNHEMHMKMCKKIAQLTKVIYALNTKNDEHEATIQAIKEAHQEEIQRIIAETRGKILQYRNKVGEEIDLRQHIQTLEDALEQHKTIKEETLADFAVYKKQVEERELKVETEHAERIMSLSKEMLDMKKDFENKVQHFTELQNKLELDKQTAISELVKQSHESEDFQKQYKALSRDSMDEREKLEEKHKTEVQALIKEKDILKSENIKITEESEQKVLQLQLTHEKEKEALKKALQQSVAETVKQWQQWEVEHRKSLQAQEAALQHKMKKLEADLEAKGQKINECKKHSQKLQERIKDLEIQLQETRQDASDSRKNANKMEEELIVAKERLILQENEILNKSEQVKHLLASQNKAIEELNELKSQVVHLQQQVQKSDKGYHSNRGTEQLKQTIEALGIEKQELQKRYEEELKKLRRQSDEEKLRIKEQLVKRLEELVNKHTAEIKTVQCSVETERKKLQKELQVQLEELKRKSENEKSHLEKEKENLSLKLQDSLLEVSQLETLLKCIENNSDQTEALSEAKAIQRRLQQEVDEAQSQISELQEELELQKKKYQTVFYELQKEKEKLKEQITEPIDLRFKEKIRAERDQLHEDAKDLQSTIGQIQKEKEAEIKRIQEEWQIKVMDLQNQIIQLKKKLDLQTIHSQDTLQELKIQFSSDKEKVLQELQESMKQNQILKACLEASQQHTFVQLEKNKTLDVKEIKERLRKENEENLKIQHQAHRLELQALEKKTKRELQAERERMENQQKLLLESLRMELIQQNEVWTSQVTHSHKRQIDELQNKLNSIKELKKQEGDNYSQKEELEKCYNEICGLKKENALLKDTIDLFSGEMESKTQAVMQLKDRDEQQRMQDLKTKHRQAMDSLKQDHQKEIQIMVSEFSSAQARLQAKIVSLETMLKETEEKRRNHELKSEELHLIGRLQDKLSERDQVIRRLMEEQKFNQAATITSESYMNRSFSCKPNPGSLTPTMKKKKTEESPSRVVSVPNLSSYEKSFQGCESNPTRRNTLTAKPPNVEQSPAPGRPYYQSMPVQESKPLARSPDEENCIAKGAQGQDPQRQEWFTKYFSF